MRSLGSFNKALLTKVAWLVHNNSSSLLAKVYVTRYTTNPLEATYNGKWNPGWSFGFEGIV